MLGRGGRAASLRGGAAGDTAPRGRSSGQPARGMGAPTTLLVVLGLLVTACGGPAPIPTSRPPATVAATQAAQATPAVPSIDPTQPAGQARPTAAPTAGDADQPWTRSATSGEWSVGTVPPDRQITALADIGSGLLLGTADRLSGSGEGVAVAWRAFGDRFAIERLAAPAPRFARILPTVAAAAGPLTVIGGSGETGLCAHPFGGGNWVSDGSGWRAKPFEPEDCTRIPGPLAAGPAGILDVSSATGEVYGAWLSGDGLRWTDVTPRDAGAAQLWGAVFGGGRYLISGRDGSHGVLWSSPDARSWTRELERTGVDLGVPVAAGGTVLVTATTAGGPPVILRWDAGSGWGPVPADTLPAGAIDSLQRAGDVAALVGTSNGIPAAWLSSDGAAWLRLALPDEGAATIGLIGRIGERLVVVQDIDTPAGSTQLVLVRGWPLP